MRSMAEMAVEKALEPTNPGSRPADPATITMTARMNSASVRRNDSGSLPSMPVTSAADAVSATTAQRARTRRRA
jgi:hypothetical protein